MKLKKIVFIGVLVLNAASAPFSHATAVFQQIQNDQWSESCNQEMSLLLLQGIAIKLKKQGVQPNDYRQLVETAKISHTIGRSDMAYALEGIAFFSALADAFTRTPEEEALYQERLSNFQAARSLREKCQASISKKPKSRKANYAELRKKWASQEIVFKDPIDSQPHVWQESDPDLLFSRVTH